MRATWGHAGRPAVEVRQGLRALVDRTRAEWLIEPARRAANPSLVEAVKWLEKLLAGFGPRDW